MSQSFRDLILEINKKAKDYNIGQLQKIRSELRGGMNISNHNLFSKSNIKTNWAHHHGGSQELQFNIAYEDNETRLRFGLALSLQTTQSLLDVTEMYPHVLALNDYIVNEPFDFSKYVLYRWKSKIRTYLPAVTMIPDDWVSNGNFIFLGKVVPIEDINVNQILSTFDELLEIYINVQEIANPENTKEKNIVKNNSVFKLKNGKKPQSDYSRTTTTKQIDVTVRHNLIQEIYAQNWKSLLGDDKVTIENPIGYKSIDIVIDKGDHYEFTEIKTAGTAKECIRQAFGQLLEYGFFFEVDKPVKLVVVGEKRISKETSNYLHKLNKKLLIPISYRDVTIKI